jgi:deoxyhypusine monooxygenase
MVHTRTFDEKVVQNLHSKLSREDISLPEKYRVLFSLRNCANASALPALLVGLKDPSALFRHDVAFAIGQRQDKDGVEALVRVLDNAEEDPMVRHEAAEALGAIGTEECLQPLRRHESDHVREVAETCLLARQRVQFMAAQEHHPNGSNYMSVDPTPPFDDDKSANELHDVLMNEGSDLFDRYRALFSLRNAGGQAAVDTLADCMKTTGSALLKHEIAYVLGQMQDKHGIECLKRVLQVLHPHEHFATH